MPDQEKNLPTLMVRFGHLGDVALTTGVLEYRSSCGYLPCGVLTKAQWEPIFFNNPHVSRIHTLPSAAIGVRAELKFFQSIARQYAGGVLLDFHGNLRSYLLGSVWHGTVQRYRKMTTDRRLFLSMKHVAAAQRLRRYSVGQRYVLAFQDTAPPAEKIVPKIYLTTAEEQAAQSILRALTVAQRTAVALHPFATHPNKTWPAAHWRKFAELLDRRGIPWIIIGQGDPLFPDNERDLTGRTTLRESCALLGRCRVLVTGDSGPMHLASAVGTPVIALFGPTTQEWGFFPAGPHDLVLETDLPCRPCSLHGRKVCPRNGECLARILPETVLSFLP